MIALQDDNASLDNDARSGKTPPPRPPPGFKPRSPGAKENMLDLLENCYLLINHNSAELDVITADL